MISKMQDYFDRRLFLVLYRINFEIVFQLQIYVATDDGLFAGYYSESNKIDFYSNQVNIVF